MKKIGRVVLTCGMLLALAGCGQEKTENTGSTAAVTTAEIKEASTEKADATEAGTEADTSANWYFKKGDLMIEMGAPAEPVVKALEGSLIKEPFESPSCAFDGMDIAYSYPGFELYAFRDNGKDVITQVVLRDDTVETPEGIYIGSKKADVDKAYSSYGSANGNHYTLKKGNCTLLIILNEDVVSSIQYSLITEE